MDTSDRPDLMNTTKCQTKLWQGRLNRQIHALRVHTVKMDHDTVHSTDNGRQKAACV